jgi:pimeloyl-ACP methyl ester carboxylesterase
LLPAATAIPGGEGYVVLGAYGQAAANPALSVADVLDPAALERGALVEEGCLIDVSLELHQVALDTRRPIGRLDGFRQPAWSQQLASIKPGQEPIAAPVLVVQGVRDLIVPVQTTAVLTARLCDRGDVVHTVTYPGVGHSDVVIAADAEVRSWIGDRLAGTPATSDC